MPGDHFLLAVSKPPNLLKIILGVAIIRPHTKYKTPLNPKIHPEIHPKSLPKPKHRKDTKNIRNWVIFVYFSYFFCISVLEGDLGCISGCILGLRGVLYFVWGTYDHNLGELYSQSFRQEVY